MQQYYNKLLSNNIPVIAIKADCFFVGQEHRQNAIKLFPYGPNIGEWEGEKKIQMYLKCPKKFFFVQTTWKKIIVL